MDQVATGVDVSEIKPEPFRIPYAIGKGKQRKYVPDFLVRGCVYEIKPLKRLATRMNEAKILAAVDWCEKNALKFEVIVESDVNVLSLAKVVFGDEGKHIEWFPATQRKVNKLLKKKAKRAK